MHAARPLTHAERVRLSRTSPTAIWTGDLVLDRTSLAWEVREEENAVRFSFRGRYLRSGVEGQGCEGEWSMLVRPHGIFDVRYAYAPISATDTILEAGLSLHLPEDATQLRWIGDGPFAGYPGKDRLNEFGAHHLHRDDIRFSGNRRGVDLAMVTNDSGVGTLLLTEDADVAIERRPDGLVLRHNAVVSGLGNKAVPPERLIDAAKLSRIAGEFSITFIGEVWPEWLVRWFGEPGEPVDIQRPFFHSYDQ